MRFFSSKFILVIVLVGLSISLFGLSKLKTNADYRVYFDKTDALLQKDEQLGNQYSHLDSLLVILEAKQDTLLKLEFAELYGSLQERLYKTKYVKRVDSFFEFFDNEASIEAELDGMEDNRSQAELLQQLHGNPRSTHLINDDGRFGLIEVGVQLPSVNTAIELKSFMLELKSVVNSQLDTVDSIAVHYSGTLALNEAYIDVVRSDLKFFAPLLILIFIASLFAFFRSWGVCCLLITTAFLSALGAFGVAGWMGWELAAINAFTPIIIMSLNIATTMHIVVSYYRFVADGTPKPQAMERSIEFNFTALTLSKFTTVLGFLLLFISPSPPVQVVGFTVAVGMLFSYLLCLSMLRLVLPKIALSAKHARSNVDRFSLSALGRQVLKHYRMFVLISVVILIFSSAALSQLQVNDNVYKYFPKEHSFRQGTELVEEQFDGSIRLFYSIDASTEFGILEPVYTKNVMNFTAWLRQQDEVTRIDDVFTHAKKRGIDFLSIKSFLENNTPEFLGLEQFITEGYDATKIAVYLKGVTARGLLDFDSQARQWLDSNITPANYVGGVGPNILFARLGEINAKSMFFTMILALVLIALLTGFLMRSFAAAFIGLVCNLFPVLVIFAVWVIVGGYISLGSAMVMGLIMGIIVDDTLHLLLKYPRNDSSSSNDILWLFEKVSPAIVITSITLSAGLFVGVFSDFRPIYELSLLSLSIIMMAMLTDLVLIPALMKSMNFTRI